MGRLFHDVEAVTAVLADLGGLLHERGQRYEFCVVGGVAFLLGDPASHHATSDVDIAAGVSAGRVQEIRALPNDVVQAAEEIGKAHGLKRGWLSAAFAASFGAALPPGFVERADVHDHRGIVVHVASREDLIALKLLAAISRRHARGRRHVEDLVDARVTMAEVERVLPWVHVALGNDAAFADREAEVIDIIRAGEVDHGA